MELLGEDKEAAIKVFQATRHGSVDLKEAEESGLRAEFVGRHLSDRLGDDPQGNFGAMSIGIFDDCYGKGAWINVAKVISILVTMGRDGTELRGNLTDEQGEELEGAYSFFRGRPLEFLHAETTGKFFDSSHGPDTAKNYGEMVLTVSDNRNGEAISLNLASVISLVKDAGREAFYKRQIGADTGGMAL